VRAGMFEVRKEKEEIRNEKGDMGSKERSFF
jgi:hypothetical protein